MSWLAPGTRVHVVGVGGAGMSGVARLLSEYGCVVSGSDARASTVLGDLAHAGVAVAVGADAAHGASAQVVLWSPAVPADHPELVAARARGATMVTRAELLGELATRTRVIGLTGTHGKTTATSMMVHVLIAAGRDDARLLGAPVPGVGVNGHWASGDLVLEVDESYGTFALLAPHALGLLNVEADHLDHYGRLEDLEAAFAALVARVSGPVVWWSDDAGARRVARAASRPATSVGTGRDAQWRVGDVALAREGSSFTLCAPGASAWTLRLAVTGAHNVADAAVVAVLAAQMGVDEGSIARGLAAFPGAPRRFEHRGRWAGAELYEDYAHLPGEVAATLATLRAIGFTRVTAVFQPHRVSRTLHLADEFAPAFDDAAEVVVTDIYRAGEANPQGVTGSLVADALARRRGAQSVHYAPGFDDVLAALEGLAEPGDAVVFLGAGDVAEVVDLLARERP